MFLPHQGTTSFREREQILAQVAAFMPSASQVLVLGDRKFGYTDMMRSITYLDWDYALRVIGNVMDFANDDWEPFNTLASLAGQQTFLTGITLTKSNCLCGVNFAMACAVGCDDP